MEPNMFILRLRYAEDKNSKIIWKSTIFLRFRKPRVLQIGNHAKSKTPSTVWFEFLIKTGVMLGMGFCHPHDIFLRESALFEYGSLRVISSDLFNSVPFQQLCLRERYARKQDATCRWIACWLRIIDDIGSRCLEYLCCLTEISGPI